MAARNSDPQRRGLVGKRFYPQILLRNLFCEDFCPECMTVRASEETQEYERRSRYCEKHPANKTIPRHATLDTDVFVAWPFQGLIVSERAATIFESLKLGNIAISKIQVLDETPRESLQRLLEEEKKDGEK